MLSLISLLAASPTPSIPYTKYTLDNGLQVILSEDRSVPFVWTNLWYYVGSKDEEQGKTGFAHLFEHMMFQGSGNIDQEYFQPLQAIGAQINGTTNMDRTNFFEGVPSRHLPLALFMESDRMGWLLDVLTPEKFANQQEVVRNERRQRYENRPYGNYWLYLVDTLFPEGHPYHHATIGSHEDLAAASVEDVKAFFRRWYLPNNAALVICGDYDEQEARAQVQRWFGDIPAGEEPPVTTADPVKLDAEKVVIKKEKVPYPKIWIAWPTPPVLSKEDAALDLLASVLGTGKDSRLVQALVYQQKLAQDVRAYQSSMQLQSVFIIEATAAPGHTADELVAAIDTILADFKLETEEFELAKIGYEVQFFENLESIQGKANLLNHYNYLTGDPGYIEEDLERYRSTTKGMLKKVLKRYLPLERRVILQILPEGT
jgi:zinc protease